MNCKEKIQKLINGEMIDGIRASEIQIGVLKALFPEFTESEDERIKKEIINFLELPHPQFVGKRDHEKWIAWLEKQGEKSNWKPSKDEMDALYGLAYITNKMDDKKDEAVTKLYQDLKREFFNGATYENMFPSSPVDSEINIEKQGEKKHADKVEPKFKVGNWYQCTKDFFGKGVTFDKNTAYYCAKEGCLQNEYGCHIAIVKDLYDNFKLWTIQDAKDGDVLYTSSTASHETFIFKSIDEKGNAKCYFAYDSEDGFRDGKYHFIGRATNCKPATKEQRDLLFSKIKEAGYEWDVEHKQLKKIEQKPAWSEEDSSQLDAAINIVASSGHACTSDWLKSLKDKVQPEQKWSKNDEDMLILSIKYLEDSKAVQYDRSLEVEKCKAWLRSLKSKSQWKPSDEQMEALKGVQEGVFRLGILKSLYNDLKKLLL